MVYQRLRLLSLFRGKRWEGYRRNVAKSCSIAFGNTVKQNWTHFLTHPISAIFTLPLSHPCSQTPYTLSWSSDSLAPIHTLIKHHHDTHFLTLSFPSSPEPPHTFFNSKTVMEATTYTVHTRPPASANHALQTPITTPYRLFARRCCLALLMHTLTYSRTSIAHFSHVAECSIDTLLSSLTASPQFPFQTALETHLPTPLKPQFPFPSHASSVPVTNRLQKRSAIYEFSSWYTVD